MWVCGGFSPSSFVLEKCTPVKRTEDEVEEKDVE